MLSNLTILYYLPSLFHFIVDKSNEFEKGIHLSLALKTLSMISNPAEDKDKDTSTDTTLSHDQVADVNGSLRITSNICNLIHDTDDQKGIDPNLVKVDRDAKRIKKRGHHDT